MEQRIDELGRHLEEGRKLLLQQVVVVFVFVGRDLKVLFDLW
jgi:hypothetical protein